MKPNVERLIAFSLFLPLAACNQETATGLPALSADRVASAKKLKAACGTDENLFARIRPFSGLLRSDTFGRPVVIRQGSVFVTAGTDRRSSGTHYTPRSLTEPELMTVRLVLGDITEETRWVMRRLSRMLEYAGASMADVARVDVHLTNLDTIHTMDAAYAEFFENKRYPARTCTESPRLSGGSNVEITLMARQPEKSDG